MKLVEEQILFYFNIFNCLHYPTAEWPEPTKVFVTCSLGE